MDVYLLGKQKAEGSSPSTGSIFSGTYPPHNELDANAYRCLGSSPFDVGSCISQFGQLHRKLLRWLFM